MMTNIFYGLRSFLSVMFDIRDSVDVFKIKWFFVIGFTVAVATIVKEIFNRTSNTLQFWILRARVALGFKLENKTSYYQKCVELLSYAAINGHTDRVKVLLAAGVDANENALRYAVSNRHLDVIKVLLAAGAHLKSATRSEVAFFLNNINYIIHNNDPKLALCLLKVMPEELINLVLSGNVGLRQLKIVHEYRLDKLKESLFESVWAIVKTMRQADPSLAEPKIIRDQILPMLKPEWCSKEEYKKLSKEVFNKTLIILHELDKKPFYFKNID